MARSFDGANSKAQGTVTAVDTGDWTIFAWIKPNSAGEGGFGCVLRTDNGSGLQSQQMIFDGSLNLLIQQNYSSTVANTIDAATIPTGAWTLVIATYTDSDKKCRLYKGSLSSAVSEASYSTQTAGAGTRQTGLTTLVIGNSAPQTGTFDGSIARAGLYNRLFSLSEMEALRLGWEPAKDGTERGRWRLDSPTATQVEDAFGAVNLTATLLTVAEDPPIPIWQSGDFSVLAEVAAAPQTVIIGQAVETDTAFPIAIHQTILLGQAVETDTAFAISAINVQHVGQAVETDTAHAMSIMLGIGIARETERALPINPVLPEEPPAPTPIPGGLLVGSGPLARGEHRVFIYGRGGTPFVGEVGFTSLNYSRRLDDKSTAQVTIGAGSAPFLGDLRGWKHELLIARDGEPVWLGPIHEPVWEPAVVTLPADDLLGWLDNRVIAADLDMRNVDLATVFARLVHDAMAREPSPGLFAAASLSGVMGDRSYVAAQHPIVGDALRSLGQSGVDYSCILRKLHIGALSLLPSIILTDDTLLSPRVAEGKAATTVNLVGATTATIGRPVEAQAGGPNIELGLLEKTINDPDVMTYEGADHYARDAYAFLNPAPLYVSGVLAPSAPVDMESLIPGMHVAAKLTGTDRQVDVICRLTQVDVTVSPREQGQQETVGVTLVPVGLEG